MTRHPRVWIWAAALILIAPAAGAHPAPFSFLDIRIGAQTIDGSLVLHDLDVAHDLGVNPPERLHDPEIVRQYFASLTSLMDSRIAFTIDGRRVAIEWGEITPLPERQSLRLAFRLPGQQAGVIRIDARVFTYDPIHQTFINIYERDTLRHQVILDDSRRSFEYFSGTAQGAWAVVRTFVPSGIEHILIGPDHVLFLIGLLLLGGSIWRLAAIVTAFTIGHSITLSLAALNIVSPPASLIEPAIALSIVFVGADNLLVQRERSKGARDIRAYAAGVFGLVHGFGFASVLREFGLPDSALGWSLFSFNLGVEVGQLAIVIVVASALEAIRRRSPRLGQQLAFAGSLVVIAAGGYWFLERVFFTGAAS
jgi:hydrogenase/urease accessory protein HupE